MARAVLAFDSSDEQLKKLIAIIRKSNVSQFNAIIETVEEGPFGQRFREQLSVDLNQIRNLEDQEAVDHIGIANFALALFRLGQTTPFVEIASTGNLKDHAAIVGLSAGRTRPFDLRRVYESSKVAEAGTKNVSFRRTILQMLSTNAETIYQSRNASMV